MRLAAAKDKIETTATQSGLVSGLLSGLGNLLNSILGAVLGGGASTRHRRLRRPLPALAVAKPGSLCQPLPPFSLSQTYQCLQGVFDLL